MQWSPLESIVALFWMELIILFRGLAFSISPINPLSSQNHDVWGLWYDIKIWWLFWLFKLNFFILTWKYATRVEINGENISFFEGIYRYNWLNVKYQRILPLKMLLTFWTQKQIAYAYWLILYMAGKHRIRNTSATAATQISLVSTAVLKFCTSAVAMAGITCVITLSISSICAWVWNQEIIVWLGTVRHR